MNEGFNDALEHINWRDAGCDLHPACLQCPLPQCIEEVPRGRQKKRMDGRSEAMLEMKKAGSTTKEIAARFGVSLRTVQRALAGGMCVYTNDREQRSACRLSLSRQI